MDINKINKMFDLITDDIDYIRKKWHKKSSNYQLIIKAQTIYIQKEKHYGLDIFVMFFFLG